MNITHIKQDPRDAFIEDYEDDLLPELVDDIELEDDWQDTGEGTDFLTDLIEDDEDWIS